MDTVIGVDKYNYRSGGSAGGQLNAFEAATFTTTSGTLSCQNRPFHMSIIRRLISLVIIASTYFFIPHIH